ncbi:SDR family NAD(P)-dependent oxidoreductase [Amycolatopsis pigmentata]|uniref:SDR family NAD(P)-dependent oxidoreductase n=1 Tax=Amycolatopsis pigmentata TaxID=450801 RepID=A0ABW5FNM8_9PSEU
MRLEGKRVLITGTAGGQGAAAQELFVREGARVIGCDVQKGGAERSAAVLRDQGHDATGYTVDLTDPEAAEDWIESSVRELGGLDVLYNNASGAGFAPFSEMTLDLWRHVMSVELDIVFHTCRPAWRHLLDGGGSLINTGSVSGMRGIGASGQAAHGAAKAGVIGLTRSLAAEGAEHGVRANSLSPGFIKSPATDKYVSAEQRAYNLSHHLIRRPGTCDEVAHLALYLASDESVWVTGQNFVIDGGLTAGVR